MDRKKRIVLLLEDEEDGGLHRFTVLAQSVVEAWQSLPAESRKKLTLYGLYSFEMEDPNAVG